MAKKEFTYRGMTLEQLQKLSIKELADILPTKVRRKISRRGFTDEEKILLKKLEKNKIIKTHCRDMIVLPFMVGKTIKIHKGSEFVQVLIEPEMIGHYFGELVLTRRKVEHHAPGIGATKSSGGISAR
jgi:small subunit ribosomal protein S19